MGVFLAVGCAVTWSISIVMFRFVSTQAHPVAMNLYKNALGFFLMIPTLYFVDGVWIHDTSWEQLSIIMFSGFIGIGFADALALSALKRLGATRFAISECLYSPFVILMSILYLGETIGLIHFVGAILILAAIILVSLRPDKDDLHRSQFWIGLGTAALGLFGMAVGVVVVKPLFAELSLFWIIELRLGFGFFASVLTMLLIPTSYQQFKLLLSMPGRGMMLIASFLSTYVAMIMWVAGFKYNDASVAAVLNQTATIFTVLLAAVFLNEKMNRWKVIGTALAFLGVALISW